MTRLSPEIFAILIVASFAYACLRVVDYLGVHVLDPFGFWPF